MSVVSCIGCPRGSIHYAQRLPTSTSWKGLAMAMSRPAEWVDRLSKLYTPVVADVLDKLGYRQQVMRSDIRPLFPQAKTAGFALTVHTVPAREIAPQAPYAGELAAVDALQKNDVMV